MNILLTKTLFEKIWDEHVIVEREDGDVLLYIDRHLTHDLHFRTFGALKAQGLSLREPDKLFGVPDHSVPTTAQETHQQHRINHHPPTLKSPPLPIPLSETSARLRSGSPEIVVTVAGFTATST